MRLRVLGCSGGIAKGLRSTSYLLNDTILLDGGTGVGDLTLDEMLAIKQVILTHAHLDHVNGLALMIASIYDDLKHTITVYAPPPVLMVLKISLFNWQLWPDFTELPDEDSPCVRLHALEQNVAFSITDEITIAPIILSHTVKSFAYYINDTKTTLCFCGDTGPTEKLWHFLNEQAQLDHLIVECSFPNENKVLALQSGHYTAELLNKDLKLLTHRPILHIQHIKPGCEDSVIDECRSTFIDRKLNVLARNQTLKL
jgi:cAMP phosphodiesterase